MGAGQSDLYKGTYGDNIDNIPDITKIRCQDDNILVNHDDIYNNLNLTDSQRSSINTLNNTLRDHLKESDFSGTLMELQGKPIVGKLGIPFQHLYEMKTSYKTLNKIQKSLEGSLKNPKLGKEEQNLLRESLNLTKDYLKRIYEMFEKYGEL